MPKEQNAKEPRVVVKPLGRFGGLDAIHLSLMALVVIMAALLVVVTYNGQVGPVLNISGTQTCAYGAVNGSCVTPLHNQSQAVAAAERFLAGYTSTNSSLSVIPYVAAVNSMNVSYAPQAREWYVTVPIISPASNSTFAVALAVSDKNLSVTPFIQTISPTSTTQNYVESYGIIRLAGKSACSTATPTQIYWFIDPYAPGSVRSVAQLAAMEDRLGSKIDARLEILYTQSSQQIANSYGLNNTLALGQYMFCASEQSNFSAFARTVNATYDGQYVSPATLATEASDSGLNGTSLASCMNTSSMLINRQAVLANYYNVTSTPVIVTDCQYQSIPQTVSEALCTVNSALC